MTIGFNLSECSLLGNFLDKNYNETRIQSNKGNFVLSDKISLKFHHGVLLHILTL